MRWGVWRGAGTTEPEHSPAWTGVNKLQDLRNQSAVQLGPALGRPKPAVCEGAAQGPCSRGTRAEPHPRERGRRLRFPLLSNLQKSRAPPSLRPGSHCAPEKTWLETAVHRVAPESRSQPEVRPPALDYNSQTSPRGLAHADWLPLLSASQPATGRRPHRSR